jgi:YbbR domain-containing protein
MPDGVKAVKEYAKDYILKNTGLKVLALLITAVLWLSVASRLGEITFPSVQILLSNPSPGLTISKVDQDTAKVFLRGPKDVIDTLRTSDLGVVADLQNVEPGVRLIPLKIDMNKLPPSIDEQSIDIEPRNIRVTVEPLVERELPIVPRLAGDLPPGYEIYSQSLSRMFIPVVAAASNIDEIKQVSTETVNIAGRTESFSQELAIDTGTPNVLTVEDNPKVMLTLVIGETRKERVFEKVPVTLVNAPAHLQLVDKSVRLTLRGPNSLMDALTFEDIQVHVDAAGPSEKAGELKPQVRIPAYGDRLSIEGIEPSIIRVK